MVSKQPIKRNLIFPEKKTCTYSLSGRTFSLTFDCTCCETVLIRACCINSQISNLNLENNIASTRAFPTNMQIIEEQIYREFELGRA